MQILKIEILLKPVEMWKNLEKSIHKTVANMINGQKGGRPKAETKPKQNQNKTKTKQQKKPFI